MNNINIIFQKFMFELQKVPFILMIISVLLIITITIIITIKEIEKESGRYEKND